MARIDPDSTGGVFGGSTPTIETPATTTDDRTRFSATPGGVFQTDSTAITEQQDTHAGLTESPPTRGGAFDNGQSATSQTSNGLQGPPGPRGADGADGAQGNKGDMGDMGDPGVDGISLTDFDVEDNGDGTLSINWTLGGTLDGITTENLTGPQGAMGLMGIQGIPGKRIIDVRLITLGSNVFRFAFDIANEDGTGSITLQTGVFSPPAGPQGDPGVRGSKGDKGDMGNRGTTGTTGAPGADGEAVEDFIVTENADDSISFVWAVGGVASSFTTDPIRGPAGTPGGQGPIGPDGDSVENFTATSNSDGTITFRWDIGGTDDSFTTIDLIGPQGIQGNPGIQGLQGRGVTRAEVISAGDGNLDNGMEYRLNIHTEEADGTDDITLSAGTFTAPRGAQGIQGNPGLAGSTPDISIGNVVTGLPGTDATVDRQTGDTDTNPIFDFGIPRGNTGAPGADGSVVTVITPETTDPLLTGVRIDGTSFRIVADEVTANVSPAGDTVLTNVRIDDVDYLIDYNTLTVAANPTPGATPGTLESISIDGVTFAIVDTGSIVVANPGGEGQPVISSISIDGSAFQIEAGGGGDTVTANDITPILSSIEVLDTITIDGAEFRLRGAPVFVAPVAASRFDINIFYDEDLFPGARTTIEKPVFDRDDGTQHQFRIEPRIVGLNGTQITDATFNFVNTSYGMFARIGTSQQFGMNLTTAQVNQFNTYDFDSQGSWTETNGTDVNVIVNQDQAVQFFSVRDWYTFTGTGLPTALSQFASQGSFTRGDDFTFSGGTEAYVLLPQTTFGTDDPVSTYTFRSGVLFLNNTTLLAGNSIAAGFSLYELNDYAGGGTLDVTIT